MMRYFVFLVCVGAIVCAQQGVGIKTDTPNLTLSIVHSDSGIESATPGELTLTANTNEGVNLKQGSVGVNTTSNSYPLDIDAANQMLKIDDLAMSTADVTNFIMIDPVSKEVGARSVANSLGQFVRIGFSETDYLNNGNNGVWQSIPFKTDLQLAPNASANYVNNIEGSDVDRANPTTETINLGAGTYSLNLRLVGMFRNSNDNNRVDARLLVNGQDYTTVESIVYGSGGGNGSFNDSVRKTGYLKDILIVNPGETAVLSLEIRVWDNDFRVYEAFVPTGSTGNSSRSIFTIQRLK